MKTKEKILALFEEHKGIYFSGEEIAEKLNVSRTAVWKAVNSLRSEGYNIDAVQSKGYSLSVNTDILSSQGIIKYLKSLCSQLDITVLPTANSTNDLLREKASEGAAEGTVIIANSQSGGKGRLGRTFYSPADTGIYMSLLLRPENWAPQQAVKLTTMAAVAACEAIEEVSGKNAAIKWVNDIYMNDRKVSGILTEASFGLESGLLEYAVLGIGINAYQPQKAFPDELKTIAGSVFDTPQNDGKNHLAAEFLNRFMACYFAPEKSGYVEKYRRKNFVIGKEINILFADGTRKATALDIDDDCRLIVQYENGKKEHLSSGEISVKLV